MLAEDETHLHLSPWVRATWIPHGQRQEVMTPGKNRRRTIFGAVDLAFATLGFNTAIWLLMRNEEWLTGGTFGINNIALVAGFWAAFKFTDWGIDYTAVALSDLDAVRAAGGLGEASLSEMPRPTCPWARTCAPARPARR